MPKLLNTFAVGIDTAICPRCDRAWNDHSEAEADACIESGVAYQRPGFDPEDPNGKVDVVVNLDMVSALGTQGLKELEGMAFDRWAGDLEVMGEPESFLVDGTHHICDVCAALDPDPCWTHFVLPDPEVGDDNGLWLLCERCHDLTERKQWQAWVDLSVDAWKAKRDRLGLNLPTPLGRMSALRAMNHFTQEHISSTPGMPLVCFFGYPCTHPVFTTLRITNKYGDVVRPCCEHHLRILLDEGTDAPFTAGEEISVNLDQLAHGLMKAPDEFEGFLAEVTPAFTCPSCKGEVNENDPAIEHPIYPRPPHRGDVAFCIKCQSLSVYIDSEHLRALSGFEQDLVEKSDMVQETMSLVRRSLSGNPRVWVGMDALIRIGSVSSIAADLEGTTTPIRVSLPAALDPHHPDHPDYQEGPKGQISFKVTDGTGKSTGVEIRAEWPDDHPEHPARLIMGEMAKVSEEGGNVIGYLEDLNQFLDDRFPERRTPEFEEAVSKTLESVKVRVDEKARGAVSGLADRLGLIQKANDDEADLYRLIKYSWETATWFDENRVVRLPRAEECMAYADKDGKKDFGRRCLSPTSYAGRWWMGGVEQVRPMCERHLRRWKEEVGWLAKWFEVKASTDPRTWSVGWQVPVQMEPIEKMQEMFDRLHGIAEELREEVKKVR